MHRSHRRRALAAMLLIGSFVVASFATATPARATTHSEEVMASLINKSRVNHGKRALYLGQTLSDLARKHSRAMADAGYIFHTKNLASKLAVYSWRTAGENVGQGGSMYLLHKAFMASPPHRANILYSAFRRVGVGVVWRGNIAFVTVLFLG